MDPTQRRARARRWCAALALIAVALITARCLQGDNSRRPEPRAASAPTTSEGAESAESAAPQAASSLPQAEPKAGPPSPIGSTSPPPSPDVIEHLEARTIDTDPPHRRVRVHGRIVDPDGRPVAGAQVTLSRATCSWHVSHSWALDLDTAGLSRIAPDSVTFRTAYWQQSSVLEVVDFAWTLSGLDGGFALAGTFGRAFGEQTDVVVTAALTSPDAVSLGGEALLMREEQAFDGIDVVLSPRALLTVRGLVDGWPRADLRVVMSWRNELSPESEEASLALQTDARGLASHWLPAGPVHLRVEELIDGERRRDDTEPRIRTIASEVRSIALAPGGTTCEVELSVGATIEGVVTDGRAPCARVRVIAHEAGVPEADLRGERAVRRASLNTVAWTETDEQGRFRLSGLAAGRRYVVTFGDADQPLHRTTRELDPPIAHVEVRMVRAGPLRVELRFRAPRPEDVPNDSSWGHLEHYVSRFERLDEATGRFLPTRLEAPRHRSSFEALCWFAPRPGTWRVVAFSGMHEEVTSQPVIVEDGCAEILVPVDLEPGRVVVGRVVDSTGRPLDDAVVFCDQNGRAPGKTEFPDRSFSTEGVNAGADADGRFTLQDVPVDDTTFVVWRFRAPPEEARTVSVPAGLTLLPDIVLGP